MTRGKTFRSAINRLRGKIGSAYKDFRKETDHAHMALLQASRTWPRAALKAYQWQRLAALLARAWHTVPFYRRRMEQAHLAPRDVRTEQDFQRMAVLTRADLLDNGEQMISSCSPRCRLQRRLSAGSTGQPVGVYLDARRLRLSVTEEIWADGWSGWRPGEPVAQIWGDDGRDGGAGLLRRWVRGHVLSPGFVVDARRLDRGSFAEFVRYYRSWRPRLVVAYASALRLLSEFLLEERISLEAPRAVISSAELLDESTRALAERAFASPVLDRYGCREAGLLAFQCGRCGRYHVNMLRIYLEIVRDDGRAAAPGECGRVLLTDLGNFAMPLIRYEVGDLASWAPGRSCPCGTGAECLGKIEGRTSDFLCSPRGDRIHRAYFNSLILSVPGVRQYRLVQESLRSVRLEVVRSGSTEPAALGDLCEKIRQALGGDCEVRLCRRSDLPRTASGKQRYVESLVSNPPAMATEE